MFEWAVSDWEFRNAWLLLAVLAAPLVYWLALRRPATLTFSSLSLVRGLPGSWRARLARVPALCLALAAAATAIAMAGPRVGDATTRIRREGIAITMVVDRSGSMWAFDFQREDERVDRLTVVKEVFRDFVSGGVAGRGRPDDLIGLVTFARHADGVCPLTLDHGNLLQILDEVEIAWSDEDGTALGEGLGLAVERLSRHEQPSKVAILLTDGINNAGDLDPLAAADLAARHGVRVYCIGVGTDGRVPFPRLDRRTGRPERTTDGRILLEPWPVRLPLDERTLQAIASRTDGKYYNARSLEDLTDIYREIDRLERREITEVRYQQYEERHVPFVLAALCLLFAGELLAGTVLRRLP